MHSKLLLGARFIRIIGSRLNSLTELDLSGLSLDIIAEISSLKTPLTLRVLTLEDTQYIAMWHHETHQTFKRLSRWIHTANH